MKKVRCQLCNKLIFKNQRAVHLEKHLGLAGYKWPKKTLDSVFK